jgi:Ni,Fe-hydrogenase III small subunit
LLEGAGCGGCFQEAQAALTSHYGAARRGIQAVGAAAHADVLVLCGPMPSPLAEEVQRLAGTLAVPWTRVQLGDCAQEEGAQAFVPGCPPPPEAILVAIETAWKQTSRARAKADEERLR